MLEKEKMEVEDEDGLEESRMQCLLWLGLEEMRMTGDEEEKERRLPAKKE